MDNSNLRPLKNRAELMALPVGTRIRLLNFHQYNNLLKYRRRDYWEGILIFQSRKQRQVSDELFGVKDGDKISFNFDWHEYFVIEQKVTEENNANESIKSILDSLNP